MGQSRALNRLARAPIPWTAELELVGNLKMKALNKAWRGKDYATDVLSFRAPTLFREQGMIGEIVICVPVAQAQARQVGHSLDRELDLLLVHGALHLLGLDHEKSKVQARRMSRFEAKLLRQLRVRTQGLITRSSKAASKKRSNRPPKPQAPKAHRKRRN